MENTLEKPKTAPKDFFLNLGSIILLYTGVINILNLMFAVIEKKFPDPAIYYSFTSGSDTIRWAVASLVIVYPLYIYFINLIGKDISINFEKKNLGIRKWLTYLTLFIAGTTITVDLVVLLNAFLGGELTTRFMLKVISVFVVLALVFEYYLLNLRENYSYNKKIFWTATVLIILSIITGFYVMGSPATQRKMRFDETKIYDLQSIQSQIINYWQQKEKIPSTLADLNDSISGFITPKDPETTSDYGYEIISATAFKLCANFNLDGENRLNENAPYPAGSNLKENWDYKKGYYCFDRSIDVELYPNKSKVRLIQY